MVHLFNFNSLTEYEHVKILNNIYIYNVFYFPVKRRKVRDYKGIHNSLLISIITNLFFLTLKFESNSAYLFTHTHIHNIIYTQYCTTLVKINMKITVALFTAIFNTE